MDYKMFESNEGNPPAEVGIANEVMAQIEAVEMEVKRSKKKTLSMLEKIRHKIGGGALLGHEKKPAKNDLLDHLVEIGAILAGYHLRSEFVRGESLGSDVERLLGSASAPDLGEAVFRLDEILFRETGHILSSCITPHLVDKRKNPTPHFLKTVAELGIPCGGTGRERYSFWATSVDYYRELGEENFVKLLQEVVQPNQTERVDIPMLMERQRPRSIVGPYEEDEPEMG